MANAVHRDLDLYFQGHTISGNHIIFNIWMTVRASKNVFVEVDSSHFLIRKDMLYKIIYILFFTHHKFVVACYAI